MDLYFEMYSGIAGDMTIGALLDLGAKKEVLEKAIYSLNLEGFDLIFDRKIKNGIDAYNFDVLLQEKKSKYGLYGHEKKEAHVHRNLADIRDIIESSDLNERVKKDSLGIFEIIAQAESKAHGIDINEVHFHEVGAIDSIIDIVGVASLIDDLGVENIYFSDLYEGIGYQNCAHGPMPIPVPAVANILKDSDLFINIIDEEGEHITPTGAAIVKYYYKEPIDKFRIKNIGLGAGNKDFEKSTNILRVMEIEKDKKKL